MSDKADKSKVMTVEIGGVTRQLRRYDLVRMAMGKKLAERKVYLIENIHRTDKNKVVDGARAPQWRDLWSDPSPDQRVVCHAQGGKSLNSLVTLFAAADLGLESGFVMPTDPKRNEFVHNRVERTLEHTPYYRERIRLSGGADSTHEKQWLALDESITSIHFATAASQQELIAFSADLMIIDEKDRCDRANLRLYPSRMEQSDYQLTMEVSTPTLPGYKPQPGQAATDNIWTEFMCGDQMKWHVKCPSCQLMQVPEWYTHVVKVETDDAGRIIGFNTRDQDWSPGGVNDIRIVCPNCNRPFDRMTEDARWVAMAPGARIRSRWVNRLCSDIGKPIAEIVDRFGKALNNPTQMQQVHNMDLGIPYSGGFVGFREDLFERCAGPDRYTMPDRSEVPTTIGIDVNVPFFDVHISCWKRDCPERPQVKLYCGKIQGRKNLYELIQKYNVKYGLIDQQPEMNLSLEIQEELWSLFKCRLTRAHYSTHEIKDPVIVSEGGELPYDPPKRVTLDRTSTLDRLYASMLERRVYWFSNYKSVCGGAVLDEMTRPVRTVVEGPGGERYAWVNGPDHQMHAANLDLLAGHLGELGMHQYASPILVKTDYSTDSGPGPARGMQSPEQQIESHAKRVGMDNASREKRAKEREGKGFKPLILRGS